MKNRDIDPTELYAQYVRTRSDSVSSPQPSLREENSVNNVEIADSIYHAFQRNRVANREAAIDNLMSLLEASPTTPQARTRAKYNLPNLKSSEPIAPEKKRTHKTKLASLSRRFTDSINKNLLTLRFMVPAVAAAFFALVFVPTLLLQTEPTELGVPESLLSQASSVADFLAPDGSAALSFSESANTEKNAFFKGAESIDLALALESGNADTISLVVDWIKNAANSRGDSKLAETANASLKSATESGNAITSSSHNRLALALAERPADTPQQQWFDQGRAIRATALAAQLASVSGGLDALQDTLAYQRDLGTEHINHPVQKLIGQLQQYSETEEISNSDTQEIISLTNNIFLLLR